MSEPAYEQRDESPEETRRVWRERINEARADRKRFEPTWLSNLAFAMGKHNLLWSRQRQELVEDPRYQGSELYTADRITEYRNAALGELISDDDRPELLIATPEQDEADETLQEELNAALAHAWTHEAAADEALIDARRKVIDLGTAAIRVRFDPTVGPPKQEQVPFHNGAFELDIDKARALMAAGPRPDVEMRTIREGRIRWEVLSPFNLLVPAGIENEKDFPWDIIVRPRPLDAVREEFGPAAAGLREDTDIASIMGLGAREQEGMDGTGPDRGGQSRHLRGHVWLYSCYERPCRKYPNGRVITLAGNDHTLLRVTPQLPYKDCDGGHRTGISYMHWWRVTGRFWGRALIEPLKDPQRLIDRRRTQNAEIIDRGMPKTFAAEGSPIHKARGVPLEIVEFKEGMGQPQYHQGIGPGEWMYRDIEEMALDLQHASTINEARLGENPENVDTYAALALLNENDQVKRAAIYQEHQLARDRLVEDTVHDIVHWWGAEKKILVGGGDDDGELRQKMLDATRFRGVFYLVKSARGAAKPRSQAGELKKIDDLWRAAVESGAVAANPQQWVQWYKESLEAGQAQDLPGEQGDAHAEKAELENHVMQLGNDVAPAYYDPPGIHVPVHRAAQIDAEMAGDVETAERIELHLQAHQQIALQQAAENAPPGQPAAPAPPAQ